MYDTICNIDMKKFIFDRLVDRENICNLEKERQQLTAHINNKANVVVFAPRNYGKTSLLKNIVIDDFKKRNKKSFVFFTDLLGVKDLSSIIARLIGAFEHSFTESFPVKHIMEDLKTFLSNLQPTVSIDSITGSPSISLGISPRNREYSIQYVFALIQDISKKIPTLIVIDEFQDIAAIDEAQALFRTSFQEVDNIPIILMGSKRHILHNIFSKADAPLASWGIDIEIPPIPYAEYSEYIHERFVSYGLKLDNELSIYLQNLLYRVPESINIVCQQIIELFSNRELSKDDIHQALKVAIENRERRYESALLMYSKVEETVLIQLAKSGQIEKPQSIAFLEKVSLSNRTVGKCFVRFMDLGIIEKVDAAYRISNPLFGFYLKWYR